MAGKSTVKIEVLGDAGPAQRMFQALDKSVSGVGQTFSRLGAAVGGFVIGSALVSLPGQLMGMAQAAADDAVSVAQLEQAVKNADGSFDKFSGAIDQAIKSGQQMAFSDDQTRGALSLLTAETGSTEEALSRLSRAQDLSRGTGMDLTQAAKLLGRVSDENTGILKRYGIEVKEGATAQDLLNQVDKAFGGQAAAYAETDAAKFARMKDQIGELKESIGAALLPVLVTLLQAAGPKLIGFFEGLAAKLPGIISAVSGFGSAIASSVLPVLQRLAGFLTGTFQEALQTLAGFGRRILDSLSMLFDIDPGAFGSGIGGAFAQVAALAQALLDRLRPIVSFVQGAFTYVWTIARDAVLTFVQALQGNWADAEGIRPLHAAMGQIGNIIRGQVIPAVQSLIAFVTGSLIPGFQSVATTVIPIAENLFQKFVNHLPTILAIGAAIGTAVAVFSALSSVAATVTGVIATLTAAWATVTAAIALHGTVIGAIVAAIGGPLTIAIAAIALAVVGLFLAWQTNFLGIRDIVGQVIPVVVGFVQDVGARLQAFGQMILPELLAAWSNVQAGVSAAVSAIQSVVTAVFGAIAGFIRAHQSEIQAVISAAWEYIKGTIQNALTIISNVIQLVLNIIQGDWSGAWENVKNILSAVWDQIKNVLGTALDALKAILSLALDGIKLLWSLAWSQFTQIMSDEWERAKSAARSGVDAIKAVFSGASTWLISAGEDIVRGLITGLNNMLDAVKRKAREIADAAVDAVKSFGRSPWPSMIAAGHDAGAGLVKGLADSRSAVAAAAAGLADATLVGTRTGVHAGATIPGLGAVGAGASLGNGGVNVYVTLDGERIEESISVRQFNRQRRYIGGTLA